MRLRRAAARAPAAAWRAGAAGVKCWPAGGARRGSWGGRAGGTSPSAGLMAICTLDPPHSQDGGGRGGPQGGGARHLAIGRVDGHLHVGPAALHAHLADDGHRCVAQALVLLVGQRLRGAGAARQAHVLGRARERSGLARAQRAHGSTARRAEHPASVRPALPQTRPEPSKAAAIARVRLCNDRQCQAKEPTARNARM